MTATIVSLARSSASGSPPPAIRRVAVVLTSLVAGAAGCVVAYWTWRMVLQASLGAGPGNTAWDGGPGAPWWVPSAIVGAIAMLLWPILTAHARRISLLGAAVAIALVSLLIFPIAMCVEAAALAHAGWPPIVEIAGALPRMAIAAVKITFVNLFYCGLVTLPAAALVGVLLAALGRMTAWVVRRITGPRTTGDAG